MTDAADHGLGKMATLADGGRTARDLSRIVDFRQRLVAHMSFVQRHAEALSWGEADTATTRRIQNEQLWLAQEYGRLIKAINRDGWMTMTNPAVGIMSQDVIQDAIHDVTNGFYRDLARLAQQHLDTVIGRLSADAEEEERARDLEGHRTDDAADLNRPAPAGGADAPASGDARLERLYRLTSPIYWLRWLRDRIVWVVGTVRGRVIAAITILIVAIISGVVSGVAQAWFERALAGR